MSADAKLARRGIARSINGPQMVATLDRKHRRVDVRVAERYVERAAIKFLVSEERLGDALHDRPDDGERLAGGLVESVDLVPHFVIVECSGAEQVFDDAETITLLAVLEIVTERRIDSRQQRKPNLVTKLSNASSSEHVLRGEAREMNLNARGEAIREPQPVAPKRVSDGTDANELGRVRDRRRQHRVSSLMVGESRSSGGSEA